MFIVKKNLLVSFQIMMVLISFIISFFFPHSIHYIRDRQTLHDQSSKKIPFSQYHAICCVVFWWNEPEDIYYKLKSFAVWINLVLKKKNTVWFVFLNGIDSVILDFNYQNTWIKFSSAVSVYQWSTLQSLNLQDTTMQMLYTDNVTGIVFHANYMYCVVDEYNVT
jgi:hypothetical protein